MSNGDDTVREEQAHYPDDPFPGIPQTPADKRFRAAAIIVEDLCASICDCRTSGEPVAPGDAHSAFCRAWRAHRDIVRLAHGTLPETSELAEYVRLADSAAELLASTKATLTEALNLLANTRDAIDDGFWEGSFSIIEKSREIDDFLDQHSKKFPADPPSF